MNLYRYFLTAILSIAFSMFYSCKGKGDESKNLEEYIDKVLVDKKMLLDSGLVLKQANLAKILYEDNAFEPLWFDGKKWLPVGDSMFTFITNARLYGLFPQQYHFNEISDIRKKFEADSLETGSKKDAKLWSKADLMLTDAFIQIANDLKLGRLPTDSISLRKDSLLAPAFCKALYKKIKEQGSIKPAFELLEPAHYNYHALKNAIPQFLQSFDSATYTFVPTKTDSIKFIRALQRRLFESGHIAFINKPADSATLAAAIAKFQKQKGIAADGKAGDGTVRAMNASDNERFYRIAISLDKYKMLPDTLPTRYLWVNAASNYMDIVENDKVEFSSKVICGKAKTRTPLLNSVIKEVITYPQWVPPPSIVLKEILPALKRNPGYLARRGFSLETWGGKKMNPYSVNWAKFSKSVPYKIVQGSSDGNALGIMKFVFDNKYSVYLHDTNQRYLFNSNNRSLSHGCVRVQEWNKLAKHILVLDSIETKGAKYTSTDSLTSWLAVKKRKNIPVKTPLNVYIRYITCEAKDGKVIFYDDVYEEDRWNREKYFTSK